MDNRETWALLDTRRRMKTNKRRKNTQNTKKT